MMADSEEAVSGEIFIQSRDHEEDEGTLDEPITTTLVSGVLDNGGTTCTTYLLTLPSLLPSPFPSSFLLLSLLLPSPSSSLSPFSHFVHPLATISPPLPFSLSSSGAHSGQRHEGHSAQVCSCSHTSQIQQGSSS